MGYSCQAGPAIGAPIDPPYHPYSIYVYGPNGFARELAMGHNINIIGYLFPKGTQAVSSPSLLSLSFLFPHPTILVLTPFFFQNSAHCIGV